MGTAGRGRIVVWEGASLWLLTAQRMQAGTDFHAHHAIQITIALDGGFTLRSADRSSHGPVTALAADLRHDFQAASGSVAFLFVAPESDQGRAITGRWFAQEAMTEIAAEPTAPYISGLRELFAKARPDAEIAEYGRALVAVLAGRPAADQSLDPRVVAMIAHIQRNLESRITLNRVAASVHLSPSRARHLFALSTGLPLKTFVLWQRLQRAVERYGAGCPLTEAAHDAGFADSAHLSRTFRKTFGIAASSLRFNS